MINSLYFLRVEVNIEVKYRSFKKFQKSYQCLILVNFVTVFTTHLKKTHV